MKIQDMAIIFVLIILPISLVLSAYTQYQIQTLNTQTLYDTQLTAATYDAIKAYQINAENSTTSELSNSKIRDIEASVSTFKNSIISSFRLNGYSEEELNNYIPALVYTMYDGFYIYSPFENINYQYEAKTDANGNPLRDQNGNITYDYTKPAQENGDNVFGLKPYIPYSCRYKKGSSIDIIITYALDNYIKIQGMVDGKYINESGYLVDGVTTSDDRVFYNDIEIKKEQLKEYFAGSSENGIPAGVYPYVKLNGTKYYLIGDKIIYLSNGTVRVQCSNTGSPSDEYTKYKYLIENNNQAMEYYENAKNFTNRIKNDLNLLSLTYEDAYDVDGTTQLWKENKTKIFAGTTNIENELSNFNQHRLEVIRHTIETNLSIAIANYNKYSGATNDFQMPKLKEDEWDYITHNISLISFLQGLNIGGKIYNGYTIVTNSESKEVVLEPNIYILGQDDSNRKTYHRVGDTELENQAIIINDTNYESTTDNRSAGRLNLDFNRKSVIDNNNTKYYYPLQDYNASYTSVIMQDKVNSKSYEDIYKYVNEECDNDTKTAFYIALARERQGLYKSNIVSETSSISIATIKYDANGGTGAPASHTAIAGKITYLSNKEPTRENDYKFMGWSKDPNATTAQYRPGNKITAEDMTLYAVWAELATIQYNANYDGIGIVQVITPKPIKGTTITLRKPELTREGYKLEGWSENPNATTAEYRQDAVDQVEARNMTLYAVWARIVTINYNANGGTGAPASQKTTYGTSIQLSTQVPTRERHRFDGWSRDPNATTAQYQPGNWITAEDMTLYAVWSRIVTINYNANGGTGAPASQTAIYGTSIQVSTAWLTRGEYRFEGWNTDPNATYARYYPGSWIKAEDMTLYAVWTRMVTISYDANGGTGAPASQTVAYGSKITIEYQELPTRDGYECRGWSKSKVHNWGNETLYFPGQTITLTENITLYAVWHKLVTIRYDANGGTGAPPNQVIRQGIYISIPSQTPTREGYNFLGWARNKYVSYPEYSPGRAIIAEDITLYAVWQRKGPYIPSGFTHVAGTDLNNGYTIQDSTGNQYVFVEVPRTTTVYPSAGLNITAFTDTEYSLIANDLRQYSAAYGTTKDIDQFYTDDAVRKVTGLQSVWEYNKLKQKMLKSVYQNGGFYIGKYETGSEWEPRTASSTNKNTGPIVKQNAYPYNYVTPSQAQQLANNMQSGEYTSSLLFGVQWNLTLKYLESKGTASYELNSNSASWGNYIDNVCNITNPNSKWFARATLSGSRWINAPYGAKNGRGSVLLSTGASDTFCKQGIYDLAGNVSELIIENADFFGEGIVRCGSNFNTYGNNSAAQHLQSSITGYYPSDEVGFRVSIF